MWTQTKLNVVSRFNQERWNQKEIYPKICHGSMSEPRVKFSSPENHPVTIQSHNKSSVPGSMISCFSRVKKVRCDEAR